MKFIRYIFYLFTLTISTASWGTHIVGGEIYYDCLGSGSYRVTLDVYRDCNSTGAQYDSPLRLAIYTSDGALFRNESISFPGSNTLPVIFDNPCVSTPSNICTERAIYTKVIDLPPRIGGYTLTYQRCCRGPAVVNLVNPDDAGLTLTTHIPGSETGMECNSSPRFVNYPPLALCNNQLLEFDHHAIDPDGDSIAYKLRTPFHGGSTADPAPNPSAGPPYTLVQWEAGFSEDEPMGVGSGTGIHFQSGLLTTTPQFLGKYAVGICAEEWRNGIKVGETIRDFLFVVVNCDISLAAEITPQEELNTFTSYCQGLTIDFENESFGGTNYKWDFGIAGTDEDISTQFEPSYTFPSSGVYEITLIVNPGWPCTDTAVKIFNIYEELNVSFDPPDPQCITGNSFDFEANPTLFTNVDFTWDFGPHGTPGNSNLENPGGIVFDTSGYIPISLTGVFETCEGTYTDSIFLYQEPTIDFYVDPGLKCAPYLAYFIDSSKSSVPLDYIWDFGDGTELSNEQNPVHAYENPGIYDVQLTISTDSGCVTTLTLTKDDYIEVFPSPTADFTVFPYETTVFEPWITFSDQSIDSDVHAYFFTDGDSTQIRDLTHTYDMSGFIYPYQVVWNEYGCPDTMVQEIYIKPITTIYVPNAFTPDGDGFNDFWQPIVRDVQDYELTVYDRWGNVIIQTNDTRFKWDGKNRGVNARDGVYTYVIHYRGYNKTGFDYERGHFSLLR